MSEASLITSRAARVTLMMSCLFSTTSVLLVFLPRWLEDERALAGAQIGAVIALAQLARIATGPLVAFWADSVADRRTPLRLLGSAAFAAFGVFFFLPHDFWSLLSVGFAALSLFATLTPFVEAALLRATATGPISYGLGRGIGSVAFIAANIAGGFLIARYGAAVVPIWVLGGLGALSAATWFALKSDPAPPEGRPVGARQRLSAVKALLSNRRFVVLIFACGLIQSAHAFYYSFSSLTWRGEGVSAETVGLLWSVGVAVEVAFLWTLPFFERRLAAEVLILLGAAGAVVRWLAMGFGPAGLILWPLQMLHALSFAAAHVGAMRLIYREAPEASAGMAQTLYATLSGGILLGAATLLSGVLYDWGGAKGYWAMAALALLGGIVALQLRPPRPGVRPEKP